ncbi:FecR domain-containing protein [Sphingobacterium sp.]|uniref:FecR family protein n=1 Tax=Sphingobacterium sp. TaxID=341027 RepID=UPI00289E6CAD|nr:FecR domain-containing protein [Sphingobacterium sp.]
MSIERPSRKALITYFEGSSSHEEEKLVLHYLSLDIDADYIASCMKEAWSNLDGESMILSESQQIRAWNSFQLRQKDLIQFPGQRKHNWFVYAACIAFFILSTMCVIWYQQFAKQEATPILYRAGFGKQQKVHLKDSSTVLLFPGATLKIAADFNQTNRKVSLSGRAYFKVTHNSQKPFEVQAECLTTKVLGTSFEVNTDRLDHQQTITLHTGKVNIRDNKRALANLRPNQQFIYDQKKLLYKVVHVDASQTLSWINGELSYDLVPLQQICLDLEKWYNVKIEIKDRQLADKKISTSFKDTPIQEVLHIISLATGMSYTIKGNLIKIY